MLEFEQGFNHLATLKVIGVGGGVTTLLIV